MKENEVDYLNKLFASSSDVTDKAEVDFPLLDVPEGLSSKLHDITKATRLDPAATASSIANDVLNNQVPTNNDSSTDSSTNSSTVTWGVFNSWPKVTSIAASLFVAVLGFQFYQQQQTLNQLEQAQADLATALQYLGDANRIARSQVMDSLNDNMKKAGVEPALKMGRDAVRDALEPNFQQHAPETQTQSHSL